MRRHFVYLFLVLSKQFIQVFDNIQSQRLLDLVVADQFIQFFEQIPYLVVSLAFCYGKLHWYCHWYYQTWCELKFNW